MTKEQLWEQQERTWNDNNVFVTNETAWLAGFETAMARTCEWTECIESGEDYFTSVNCDSGMYYELPKVFCPNCGGRVKEAK